MADDIVPFWLMLERHRSRNLFAVNLWSFLWIPSRLLQSPYRYVDLQNRVICISDWLILCPPLQISRWLISAQFAPPLQSRPLFCLPICLFLTSPFINASRSKQYTQWCNTIGRNSNLQQNSAKLQRWKEGKVDIVWLIAVCISFMSWNL